VLAFNNPDAKRQLLGHTIYIVAPQFMNMFLGSGVKPMQTTAQTESATMPKPAFTITDTHLILGTELAVEKAIRTLASSETPSVESAKWFTSAKSSIPSVVGLACLQDNAASGKFFWNLTKDTNKTTTSNMNIGPNPALVFSKMPVNFSLLPDFDAVKKYFGPSTLYGISKSDGFFFEFNYLNSTTAK
jgi:hypothetical protein